MDTRGVADSARGQGTQEVEGSTVEKVSEEKGRDDGEELEVDLVGVEEIVDRFHGHEELEEGGREGKKDGASGEWW